VLLPPKKCRQQLLCEAAPNYTIEQKILLHAYGSSPGIKRAKLVEEVEEEVTDSMAPSSTKLKDDKDDNDDGTHHAPSSSLNSKHNFPPKQSKSQSTTHNKPQLQNTKSNPKRKNTQKKTTYIGKNASTTKKSSPLLKQAVKSS
jgi:hypothetical protein